MIRVALLTLACWTLLGLAAVQAKAMDVIVQDDGRLFNEATRATALDRMVELHATDVRLFVNHRKTGETERFNFIGTQEPPSVDEVADVLRAVHERGLRTYVNLSWYGQNDPAQIERWARTLVERLAPLADTWAILNEPDLTLTPAACTPTQVASLLKRNVVTTRTVTRYRYFKRSRKGKSARSGVRYRRSVRKGAPNGRGHRKTIVTYNRSKRGPYVRRAYKKVVAGTRLEPVSPTTACEKVSQGETYTRILDAVAPTIARIDPSARIVGGDISPVHGAGVFAASVGWDAVDRIAVHPYAGAEFSIENLAHIRAALPKPVVLSEFGVHATDLDRAGKITAAWRMAREGHVAGMSQYTLYPSTGWDTGVLSGAGETTSVEFRVLQAATAPAA